MPFSVSSTTTFATIDWNTLENRPPIDTAQFCTKQYWFDNVPCCMDGYTVEHVLELAEQNGYESTPEARFLNKYPCINGVEIDYFYEKFTGQKAPQKPQDCDGFLSGVLRGLRALFF